MCVILLYVMQFVQCDIVYAERSAFERRCTVIESVLVPDSVTTSRSALRYIANRANELSLTNLHDPIRSHLHERRPNALTQILEGTKGCVLIRFWSGGP